MNEIQLEKIAFEPGKSFKLFSPRLRNTFLWHYHPEYELVYVEADAGIRHVGTHISGYTHSDLVFIGGNLPHLNFDYRLKYRIPADRHPAENRFHGNRHPYRTGVFIHPAAF